MIWVYKGEKNDAKEHFQPFKMILKDHLTKVFYFWKAPSYICEQERKFEQILLA